MHVERFVSVETLSFGTEPEDPDNPLRPGRQPRRVITATALIADPDSPLPEMALTLEARTADFPDLTLKQWEERLLRALLGALVDKLSGNPSGAG